MKSDTCENQRPRGYRTLKWGRAAVRNLDGLEACVGERGASVATRRGEDRLWCSSARLSAPWESSPELSCEAFGSDIGIGALFEWTVVFRRDGWGLPPQSLRRGPSARTEAAHPEHPEDTRPSNMPTIRPSGTPAPDLGAIDEQPCVSG